jgi:hypothetical protein
MTRVNDKRKYTMVSPKTRNDVINKVNNREICSQTLSGEKNDWWMNKHHPEKEVPTQIYLLGEGTKEELYEKYKEKYNENDMEWAKFHGYIRELIKQQIMILVV